MTSNFLGNPRAAYNSSDLISTNALTTREGFVPQKGMNFRDDRFQIAILLVLPSHAGKYADEWYASEEKYVYEGHDSLTKESGEGTGGDQLSMYADGRLTDNGKFYAAAKSYIDGSRHEALLVRVYEKIDPGVWFDKKIFELVDAHQVLKEGRAVFKFDLKPLANILDPDFTERMLSASTKVETWLRDQGHCYQCKSENGLRFKTVPDSETTNRHLICESHRGESSERGLLG